MNTSFDNAVAAATQPNPHVEAVKQTFLPALAQLRELQREHPRKESGWLTRLAAIQQKVQPARAAGVHDPDIERDLEELVGGRGVSSGLLLSSKRQIGMGIEKIERFGLQEFPHRNIWATWPNEPQLVRDCYGAIERTLTQLETACKDGGRLEQRLKDKAQQRGVSPRVPESVRPVAGIKVEQDFQV